MILLKATWDFGQNEVLYGKIGGRVKELWLDMPFGSKWPKCSLYPQDPKLTKKFQDFIISMKATYDSGQNEVLYVKIGGPVQELWFDTSFGPK